MTDNTQHARLNPLLYNYEPGYEKSFIYNKHRETVSYILTPCIESYRNFDFDELYVEHPNNPAISDYLMPSPIDRSLVLTGLTGCGKTSLLHSVFRCHERNPRIIGNTLIIYLGFDSAVAPPSSPNDVEQALKERIGGLFDEAAELCREREPDIKLREEVPEDFWQYIKLRKAALLTMEMRTNRKTAEDNINEYCKNHPMESGLLALKFVLRQNACTIDNVVFLMDDLESLGHDLETVGVLMAIKADACLSSRGSDCRKWGLSTIIACRDYVWRIFNTRGYANTEIGISYKTLMAFAPQFLQMTSGPDLRAIIDKRVDCLKQHLPSNEAAELHEIARLIDIILREAGDLILELNLQNYRHSLRTLIDVVFNKRWLQKREPTRGAFSFALLENDYNIHFSAILRAIALKESLVYDSETSCIPNILYNKPPNKSTPVFHMLTLLALAHFLKNQPDPSFNWTQTLDLNISRFAIDQVFSYDTDMIKSFDASFRYMLKKRLLLRGKEQEQQDSADETDETFDNVEHAYISPAGRRLWSTLSQSSALLDVLIDDIQTDGMIDNLIVRSIHTSRWLNTLDIDNYLHSLAYTESLASVELEIIRNLYANGNLRKYKKLFGQTSIVRILYLGLFQTRNSFFRESRSEEQVLVLQIDQQLERILLQIEHNVKLLSE